MSVSDAIYEQVVAERDQLLATLETLERVHKECASERDEAVGLLKEIVKADRIDAKMGYPLAGDSALAATLGLAAYEWMELRGHLERD